MRRAARLAALALNLAALSGCAALVVPAAAGGSAGGGFAAGWFSNPANDFSLTNDALKADAPLKALWCVENEPEPAAIEAYCQHIPVDVSQVPVTLIFMINASKASH